MTKRRNLLFKPQNASEVIPYTAWFKLQEGSGLVAYDESGNYDGALSGGCSQGETGQVEECYNFTGGKISCNSTLGHTALPVSFAWWQKVSSFQNAQVLASDAGQTHIFDGLSCVNLASGNIWIRLSNGTSTAANTKYWQYNSALTLNTWQSFAVVVHSMSDVDFYIDGVLTPENSINGSGTTVAFNQTYSIMRQASAVPLQGYLDEVKSYNGAWTQAQVELMYARESAGQPFNTAA